MTTHDQQVDVIIDTLSDTQWWLIRKKTIAAHFAHPYHLADHPGRDSLGHILQDVKTHCGEILDDGIDCVHTFRYQWFYKKGTLCLTCYEEIKNNLERYVDGTQAEG